MDERLCLEIGSLFSNQVHKEQIKAVMEGISPSITAGICSNSFS